ncbi:MAG TPA: preprotein translocase subunit SecE [Candidatus Bipolaricaulota bacterium]|nr:preprotein translocase subunit SecE [Candidatus Bipolaricaulota bacterium]
MEKTNRLVQYLKESKTEMKKVSWPTKKETMKHTMIVIGVSLGVALFLGALDFLFSWAIGLFL